ncbi:MAG TPA: 4Fe-4S binding protein [Kofleriaceae bacterium]|jgi:Fe-S-cluster-containing dehydrogenase component
MSHVITSECAGCLDAACVEVCPVECIVGPIPIDELRATPAAERPTRFPGIQMFIDPDTCICCDACVSECPVDAIYDESLVPLRHRDDIQRNADFFAKK